VQSTTRYADGYPALAYPQCVPLLHPLPWQHVKRPHAVPLVLALPVFHQLLAQPPARVPAGCSSLRAGRLLAARSFAPALALSVARAAQRGWSRAAACHSAPDMTGASSRPACCWQGARPAARRRVRRRPVARGTAGCGEALAGVHVKSGFIFPIFRHPYHNAFLAS
jgi:hypothetical protein